MTLANLARGFEQANPEVPVTFGCNATRTVPAGGALAGLLLHDSMIPFEMLYRVLPDPGIHSASMSRPVIMTIGAFTVPKEMALALAEYRFRPYRFDGLIPGDAVPLEDRRLSLEIGNQVSIMGGVQRGNVNAQIVPGPLPPPQNTTFAGNANPGTPGDASRPGGRLATFSGVVPNPYAIAQVRSGVGGAPPALRFPRVNPNQFVLTAAGASLIPQSADPTQGAERLPFTYYVPENTPVSLVQTVFSPVRIPMNFFEGVLSGFLMATRTLQALLREVAPCQGK